MTAPVVMTPAPAAPTAPATPATPAPAFGDIAPGMSTAIDRIAQRGGQPGRVDAVNAATATAEANAASGTAPEITDPAIVGNPMYPTTQTPADAAPEAAIADPALDPALAGESIEGTTPPTDGTPPVMVAQITADEPEGEVVLRARDPNTGQFSEMDQTRTYELSIKDKATGETKVYNKTLPDLMRMAKDGISMQKSRDELQYYRQAAPQWEQTTQQLQSEAEHLRALALELLSAPEDVVIARREAYLAEQTPEKVFARREAELRAREEALRHQTQVAQSQVISQQVSALTARLGPIMQEIEGLVGKETAAGKLALDTAHLMANGRIQPEQFAQFEAYVTGPYRDWAKTQAAQRTTQQADLQRRQDEIRRTQQRTQQAVNHAGAALRPTGGMNTPGAAPPRPPAKGVNDVMNRIISGNGRQASA